MKIEEHEAQLRSAVIGHAMAIYNDVIQDFVRRVMPAPLVNPTVAKPVPAQSPGVPPSSLAESDKLTIRNAVLRVLSDGEASLYDVSRAATKLLQGHGVKTKVVSAYKEIRRMRQLGLVSDTNRGLLVLCPP